MQSVDIILRNSKTDNLASFSYSTTLSLAMLSVMVVSLLPALASEAFATDPVPQMQNGHATAIASAQVITPYTMNFTAPPGTPVADPAITVSHRTTYRHCETLLGTDAAQVTGASCELRLIELQ